MRRCQNGRSARWVGLRSPDAKTRASPVWRSTCQMAARPFSAFMPRSPALELERTAAGSLLGEQRPSSRLNRSGTSLNTCRHSKNRSTADYSMESSAGPLQTSALSSRPAKAGFCRRLKSEGSSARIATTIHLNCLAETFAPMMLKKLSRKEAISPHQRSHVGYGAERLASE